MLWMLPDVLLRACALVQASELQPWWSARTTPLTRRRSWPFARSSAGKGCQKTSIWAIVGDDNKFSATDAEPRVVTHLGRRDPEGCVDIARSFSSRRAKMEEDPHKIPEIPGEDHAEFREPFVRSHPDVCESFNWMPSPL